MIKNEEERERERERERARAYSVPIPTGDIDYLEGTTTRNSTGNTVISRDTLSESLSPQQQAQYQEKIQTELNVLMTQQRQAYDDMVANTLAIVLLNSPPPPSHGWGETAATPLDTFLSCQEKLTAHRQDTHKYLLIYLKSQLAEILEHYPKSNIRLRQNQIRAAIKTQITALQLTIDNLLNMAIPELDVTIINHISSLEKLARKKFITTSSKTLHGFLTPLIKGSLELLGSIPDETNWKSDGESFTDKQHVKCLRRFLDNPETIRLKSLDSDLHSRENQILQRTTICSLKSAIEKSANNPRSTPSKMSKLIQAIHTTDGSLEEESNAFLNLAESFIPALYNLNHSNEIQQQREQYLEKLQQTIATLVQSQTNETTESLITYLNNQYEGLGKISETYKKQLKQQDAQLIQQQEQQEEQQEQQEQQERVNQLMQDMDKLVVIIDMINTISGDDARQNTTAREALTTLEGHCTTAKQALDTALNVISTPPENPAGPRQLKNGITDDILRAQKNARALALNKLTRTASNMMDEKKCEPTPWDKIRDLIHMCWRCIMCLCCIGAQPKRHAGSSATLFCKALTKAIDITTTAAPEESTVTGYLPVARI